MRIIRIRCNAKSPAMKRVYVLCLFLCLTAAAQAQPSESRLPQSVLHPVADAYIPVSVYPLPDWERVLAGIRRNDLYILTHPEFAPGMRTRFDAILASMPDEPVNAARAEAIGFLLGNPVFDEQLAQHGAERG